MLQQINTLIRSLKRQTCTLYLASRHDRVPRLAKVLIIVIIAYVLSPIDLIPGFIPVIGYLDELLLLPPGIALIIRMIPKEAWVYCQQQASNQRNIESPYRSQRVVIIILIRVLTLSYSAFICWKRYSSEATESAITAS